jgi:flagellar hook-basal body complex protein FliE
MDYKSFGQYISEETKDITFTFGRYNPPTSGHEKLFDTVKKAARGGQFRIYASKSNDPKKNPLNFKTKVKYLRKMFPKYARNIMNDSDVRTVFDICVKLYDQGYTKATMVVGADRLNEFDSLLNKYNNVEGRHGFYNFIGGVRIVSAGERDPDSDDVSGMSASKLRAAASVNDLELFAKGMPKAFTGTKELFNALRKAMGLKESYNHRKHIQLAPASEEREAYIEGKLFIESDLVTIKETNENGEVIMCGTNHVLVEFEDGTRKKFWLDAVEKLEEQSGAGEEGSDELVNTYINATPGQTNFKSFIEIRKKITEAEKSSEPYHKGLAKSTGKKRDAQFKKQAKMADDNPDAYKPAPGDARAETKPSKHTKKYADMFGENSEAGLKKKADATGMSLSILKQVYNRGVAAWKSGHRPGTTPEQWGYARVNSFVTKSKGTWGGADKDLAAKIRG